MLIVIYIKRQSRDLSKAISLAILNLAFNLEIFIDASTKNYFLHCLGLRYFSKLVKEKLYFQTSHVQMISRDILLLAVHYGNLW